MQNPNNFFDDLSKVTTGAMGTLAGAMREFETMMRERFKEWAGGLDMVNREEFEAVKAMAASARAEVDALKAEIAAMKGGPAPAPVLDAAPSEEAARGGAGPDGTPTA